MILSKFPRSLLPLLFAASLPLTALASEPLKTSVIKPQVGHQGISGVKVVSITPEENDQWIKVALSLPERAETEEQQTEIEEIVVVGQQDSGMKQVKPYEVVNDLEQGRSGIVIYVDKLEDFVLTINYSEIQPDVIPDRVLED